MTKRITRIALLASIYAILTCLLGPISFGIIQFRLSEVLMIFALIDFDYVYGLTLGCCLANFLGILLGTNAIGIIDIVFGSCATFIAAVLVYRFRHITFKNIPLVSLIMPVIVNGIIIGLQLALIFENNNPSTMLYYWFLYGFGVAASEFVIVSIVGGFICCSKAFRKINNG